MVMWNMLKSSFMEIIRSPIHRESTVASWWNCIPLVGKCLVISRCRTSNTVELLPWMASFTSKIIQASSFTATLCLTNSRMTVMVVLQVLIIPELPFFPHSLTIFHCFTLRHGDVLLVLADNGNFHHEQRLL